MTLLDVSFDEFDCEPIGYPLCPGCGTEGWDSALRSGEATAVCGTRWDDEGVVAYGAPCFVIAGLRGQIALLNRGAA